MSFNWEFLVDTFWVCVKAIPTTLKITGVVLVFSIILGFLFALVRMNGTRVGKGIIGAYLAVIRGIPMVVQILIIYSIIPGALASLFKLLQISINVYDINPIIYAYIVFTLNTTATTTEAFRSALMTVDRGQLEAAECAGLTVAQGYIRVVIPQALVAVLPNLCTGTVNLIKGTSLAFLMTVKDITAVAKVEAAYGYNYLEAYLDIWVIYIIVCLIVEYIFKLVEKRMKRYKLTVVAKGVRS